LKICRGNAFKDLALLYRHKQTERIYTEDVRGVSTAAAKIYPGEQKQHIYFKPCPKYSHVSRNNSLQLLPNMLCFWEHE
jgi:hypothetical protein